MQERPFDPDQFVQRYRTIVHRREASVIGSDRDNLQCVLDHLRAEWIQRGRLEDLDELARGAAP